MIGGVTDGYIGVAHPDAPVILLDVVIIPPIDASVVHVPTTNHFPLFQITELAIDALVNAVSLGGDIGTDQFNPSTE